MKTKRPMKEKRNKAVRVWYQYKARQVILPHPKCLHNGIILIVICLNLCCKYNTSQLLNQIKTKEI